MKSWDEVGTVLKGILRHVRRDEGIDKMNMPPYDFSITTKSANFPPLL